MLTWRSSEAKDGDDESWVIGKPRALASGEAEEFGKVAGFRNPDQMDRAFLQRSYEASLVPGLQDSTARLADMDRSGVAACVIYHGGLNGQSIPFSTTGLISWGHSRYNERSEEHTSELQSLMRISYAVFCLKKKKITKQAHRSN